MRISAIVGAIVMACATPAFAQTAPGATPQQLDRAERYLELMMGADMGKVLSQYIEQSYDDAGVSSEERAWLTSQLTEAYETIIRSTIRDMRNDVAEDFTAEELDAAIAFYESPLGRSVSRKSFILGAEMQEVMTPHLLAAMTSLEKKYCERFDCEATGNLLGKSGR